MLNFNVLMTTSAFLVNMYVMALLTAMMEVMNIQSTIAPALLATLKLNSPVGGIKEAGDAFLANGSVMERMIAMTVVTK